MVATFEYRGDSLHPRGTSPTLAAASAALPAGAYTSLRTYGGRRVLRLAQHVRRLEESLPDRPSSLAASTVRAALTLALKATGHTESRLRLTHAPPRLFVSVEPFAPLPEASYRDGVSCVTLGLRRQNPHAKDTRFIATADLAYRALPPGVQEGLMLGEEGAILEGLSSNFFALARGELRTEEERVLHGVTRALILEVGRGILPVILRPVRVDQLPEVDECFITSVSREILPAVRIDGHPIGGGRPGPVTRDLMGRWATLVQQEAEELF
ncbi:MAG TPA: aminotransferase class IV [Vicinamibacteria bacterium]|nr:aminotransferase class IV [Vicinamibacteria bacterium]